MHSATVWINPDHVRFLWVNPARPDWTMVSLTGQVSIVVNEHGHDKSTPAVIPVVEPMESVARRLNGGI